MRQNSYLVILIGLLILLATGIASVSAGLILPDTNPNIPENVEFQSNQITLPLSFIENQGQAPDQVKYHVAASGHTISFTPDWIFFRTSQDVDDTVQSAELVMTFPGASASPEIAGLDKQPGNANFFLGNDSSRWQNDVPMFGSIEYRQLYPGIDLRYRGTEGVLKREFVVAPGANPDQIAIAYDGIEGLSLTGNGSLEIVTPLGVLTDQAPVAYQVINGVRVPVVVSYRIIDDKSVGFTTGAYDPSSPLIIDPTLIYASFFGGSSTTLLNRVRTDTADNIYLAGLTTAADLPVQNAFQGVINSSQDAWVAKLNPNGTAVLYLTYLGGNAEDAVQGLSIDNAGNIYLSGGTKSTNFPLQSPILNTMNGTSSGFVTKLNPSNPPGSQLIYSTYIGGTNSSTVSTSTNGILADSSGNAWIAGYTGSNTLPVTDDAAQPAYGGSTGDAYIGRIAADGSLSYLTYLGGSLGKEGESTAGYSTGDPTNKIGLGLDPSGNVYVSGLTYSSDFPCLNAYDSSFGGGRDGFIAKYSPTGQIVYATYIGGSAIDRIFDLAVDSAGAVYFCGYTTSSSDFPIVSPAAQGTMKGTKENFVAKLVPSGTLLEYSTFWGGSVGGDDNGAWGIEIDDEGNAYITGFTACTDFPIVNGTLAASGPKSFVAKFTPAGAVSYSTTIGGTAGGGFVYFYDIALNNDGDVIAGGSVSNPTYTTTSNAYQRTIPATWAGGFAIISPLSIPVANFTADVTSGPSPLTVQFTDISANDPTSLEWEFGDGSPNSTEENPTHVYSELGAYTVNLTATNSLGSHTTSKVDYITVVIPPVADFTANITTGTAPLSVQFNDTSINSPTSWAWDFGDSTNADVKDPVHTYASAGNYTVNLTATNAAGTDSTFKSDFITVNAGPQITISDVSMNADGTGTATIVLDRAPTGLTGFKLDLAITNPSVSDNLTFVTYPSGFSVYETKGTAWPGAVYTNNVDTLAQGGFSSGYISAIDSGGESFPDGSTDILLATVTLHGLSAGSATLNGTLLSLTNKTWIDVMPGTTVQNGTINVTPAPIITPVANFTVNSTSGIAPLSVQFTDTSANTPSSWAWDFGDSTTSTERNATHIYSAVGTFTVSLNATNFAGSNTMTKSWYIRSTAEDGSAPLPSNRHIFVEPANDAGVKYNLDAPVFGGPDNTYYIKADGGGLNELHVTNDAAVPAGQVTFTENQTGTFWVTNTGGRGFDDDIIILLAVNGTIPDDFSVHIRTSGYNWTPSSVANQLPTDYSHFDGVVDETFTKADFIYGPQTWKPGPGTINVPSLPVYFGQDIGDTTNTFKLMFIDLKVGNMLPSKFGGVTLTDNGGAKVEYSFNNLTTFASFNAYGWCLNANQGQGISWTNKMNDPGASVYSVTGVPYTPPEIPVVNFIGDNRTGPAPLTVNFTDQSTNNPIAWAWDFQNDGTIDATTQNATWTYTTPGIYQVNLTASNAGGSAFRLKGNYINVTGLDPNLPGTDFTSDTRNGPAPLMVHFTDLTTGNPTAWAWDFQNDHTIDSTDQNATWTFTIPGIYQVNLTATNAYGNKSRLKSNYINVTAAPVVNSERIGVFRNSTHIFYLDINGNGVWNGASIDKLHNFGLAGDLPISGDWNNDAITEIGVFRPSTHMFYLDINGNGVWNGALIDKASNFGLTGDIPVSGDWDNNGITEIGVFRPSTHMFYWDINGNGVWNGALIDKASNFGLTGDIPVTGDWDNNGITKIGVFRPSTHMFYLDINGNGVWNGGLTDRVYNFGLTGDSPVSGDWNSNGITEIGVFRPSTHMFYMDYSGNGVWNGGLTDRVYNFGLTGDDPVTGIWS